jgi:type IV secretory pathway VirB2 component (pilin)
MTESSNPRRVQPVNRFLQKGALTFGACLALADEVFAQQGGGSPWTQAVQALQAAFTGPIATGLALVELLTALLGCRRQVHQPATSPAQKES